ncbi:hypothetical protein ABH17_028455 (plasmid) [Bacillus toyonensis]|nr:hypothetical protein ABH17_028455 [Bacillus toyonensis]
MLKRRSLFEDFAFVYMGYRHTSINLTYIFIQNAVFPRSFLLSFRGTATITAFGATRHFKLTELEFR